MSIKVLEWNIQGASALPWNSPRTIKKALVDMIMGQKADIIVLVEFCITNGWDYFEEQLLKMGYVFFMSSLSGKNGILICIKSDFIKKVKSNNRHDKDSLAYSVYHNFEQVVSYNFEDYNLLRVSFQMKGGRNATIIGCRIEADNKESKDEYDQRGRVFERFIKETFNGKKGDGWSGFDNGDICIVAGDFNNGVCRGDDLTKKYRREYYLYKEGRVVKERLQIHYNPHVVHDTFEALGFEMLDIGNGWGIPTWGKTEDKYVPDDHIFVRGLTPGDRVCKTIIDDDLSDHAILMAEFSIDTDAK